MKIIKAKLVIMKLLRKAFLILETEKPQMTFTIVLLIQKINKLSNKNYKNI